MNKLLDSIPYGLSVNLMGGYFARHPNTWTETKTKFYYTVWIITEGDVTISFGEKEYKSTQGDAVIFSPGDTYSARSERGCAFTFFFFTLETGNSLDLLAGMSPSGIVTKEYAGKASIDFSSSFMKRMSSYRHADIELYAEFIGYISKLHSAISCGGHIGFHKGYISDGSDMSAALKYINENYIGSPSINEIASRFGLSEKYFITKFKTVMGISPRQYIVRCKMKKALELITGSDVKISEIAETLAYSDQYAFSKAFKKFYGESPSFYRILPRNDEKSEV